MSRRGWIGIGFDGVLCTLEAPGKPFGDPIKDGINRVKIWLAKGFTVRIFTERVSHDDDARNELSRASIQNWCEKHIGHRLDVTCKKDYDTIGIWDIGVVSLVKNTGMTLDERVRRFRKR